MNVCLGHIQHFFGWAVNNGETMPSAARSRRSQPFSGLSVSSCTPLVHLPAGILPAAPGQMRDGGGQLTLLRREGRSIPVRRS
jgi:hypothetical protein